jgi:hypothetical protein
LRKAKILVSLSALLLLTIVALSVGATGGEDYLSFIPFSIANNCLDWPNSTPAAALPNQPPPVWCMITNSGPATEQSGQNTWSDDFNHGLSFADFSGTQYRMYNEIGAWRTKFWRHADHWMIDMAPHPQNETNGWNRGYTMLSPDQSFKFVNGKFVVETTVAAGHDAYDEKAWPEIIISNGPAPYHDPINLYGYDQFPEYWTLGCRLNNTRVPICALKNDQGNAPGGSAQIWEMSFWQQHGTTNFGGFPSGGLEDLWNVCEVTDPDTFCRDHFRLELTATSLKLFVNGGLFFEQSGLPPNKALPNDLLTGDIYVYLASSHVNHTAETIRYHWDNFLVNPTQAASKQAILFSPLNESVCSIPSNKTFNAGLFLSRSLLPPT